MINSLYRQRKSHLTLNQPRTGMAEELIARHQQSLFPFSRRTKSNERPPHETRVALSLLWHVLSNRGLLLSLADNLHNHQKKKKKKALRTPMLLWISAAYCLSSGYCMPFHLAACCSRTVNSLIAGRKRCENTLSDFLHPLNHSS